jgi:hypothetical protein
VPFQVTDRVRFQNNQQFAIVKEVLLAGKSYMLNVSGKSGPYKASEEELEAEKPILNGTWCSCPSRRGTFLVIGNRSAANPSAKESKYESHFKLDEGHGLSDWINSGELQDFQTIGRPKSGSEFFNLVNNRVSLIHIPEAMQSGGFTMAYRGDDREPVTIFEKGFEPRKERVTPIFRTEKKDSTGTAVGPQYDLDSNSGICASHLPEAAGLFPLIKSDARSLTDESYVYAFFAYQPFETFKIQETALKLAPEQAGYIENLLKGKEIAIGKAGIPPQTVMLAFHVSRTWSSNEWTGGCSYTVLDYTYNNKSYYNDDPAFLTYRVQLEHKLWNSLHFKRSPTFG